MLTIVLFFVVAFIAAAIASVAGFGTATMTIPFLSWLVGFKQAIILIAFFHWRQIRLLKKMNQLALETKK